VLGGGEMPIAVNGGSENLACRIPELEIKGIHENDH
jgi:hypothetical protein